MGVTDSNWDPRPVFMQYLNPEILRIYGVASRRDSDLIGLALLLTRYALLLTDGPLVLPAPYLFEVPFIDRFLNRCRGLRERGLITFAGPNSELDSAYTEKKRREYRGEIRLFPSYERDEPPLDTRDLVWMPRTSRSSFEDITTAWQAELAPGGFWEAFARRNHGDTSISASRLEYAIAAVPDRLDGHAFLPRYSLPLLPLPVSPRDATAIGMLESRAYLESYLTELDAVLLVDTVVGRLDCQVDQLDASNALRCFPQNRLRSVLQTLGLRDTIERRMPLRGLVGIRDEIPMRWLIGSIAQELTGIHSGLQEALIAFRTSGVDYGEPDSGQTHLVRDRLWRLFEFASLRSGDQLLPVQAGRRTRQPPEVGRQRLPLVYERRAMAIPNAGSRPRNPTAFVSWAHQDEGWSPKQAAEWRQTVLSFTNALRKAGIDADVDLLHLHDDDVDWTRYGPTMIQRVDFVLISASDAYRARWEGHNDPTKGAGAAREADTLKGMFNRDQHEFQRKVKVIMLPGASPDAVPPELERLQRFVVAAVSEEGMEDLLRTLTGQPRHVTQPLGKVPTLPPEGF